MKNARLAALLGAAALIVAPGCGDDDGGGAANGGSFPVTVRAENGKVRIPKRPTRIVSISATATEDLFAIGAGEQVKAVDDFSNYPKEAPRTKLSGYTPNPEAIAGYRPDLVVAANDTNHLVAALRKLRIPVLIDGPPRDLGGAYAQLEQLGRATGHEEGARRVVERMRARVTDVIRSVPRGGRPLSVYHELDPSYFTVTSKTFVGGIYELIGLRNIADAARKAGEFPKLSSEYVVSANPDLIVLADTKCCKQSVTTLGKRPGFKQVAALRNGDVLPVPDDLASHWGPRIVDFLALVAKRVERMRGR